MSTNELTAVVPSGPVTINGVTYTGVHALCAHQRDQVAADYRAALAEARRHGDADASIGRAIRALLQPGVKRRTYRRDELQRIVDDADQMARTEPSDTADAQMAPGGPAPRYLDRNWGQASPSALAMPG